MLVRCSAYVSVHWRRTDGTSISSDSRIIPLDYNTRLRIAQLQRSDEGAYSCTGSHRATGTTVFPIQLLVHGQALSIVASIVQRFDVIVFRLELMTIFSS